MFTPSTDEFQMPVCKKAFVSTVWVGYLLSNYGSFFQHYFLRKRLSDFGFVTYRWHNGTDVDEGMTYLKRIIKHIVFASLGGVLRRDAVDRRKVSLRADYLEWKFRREFRRLIGPYNERNDMSGGDICIMGSDQVFSTDYYHWYETAPNECKRVVYAGSTDWKVKSVDSEWKTNAGRILRTFSAIGVRERAGVEFLKGIVPCVQNIAHVADPVLLASLDELNGLAHKRNFFPRPTLFCYLVNIRSKADIDVSKLENLARLLECELKIVGIQGAMERIPKRYLMLLSPTEFLAAYRDARYVITNSFHGSVFAMQFKKQFLSFCQNDLPGEDQNARQRELMQAFGLAERRLPFETPVDKLYSMLVSPIDYSAIVKIVDERRNESLDWLAAAIEGDK